MNWVKACAFGLIISFSCPFVGFSWGKEPEYQDRKNDYPDFYKSYPLINLDLKTGTSKVSFLRYEESGGSKKARFYTQFVPAGKELTIRGYWISKSLIEAYRSKYNQEKNTFYKGSDYPSYPEVLQAFRASDPKALMEMLSRLSELRRTSESEDELKKVRNLLDPKRQKDPSEFYGQLAYGTGMIEVEDPSSSGQNDTRRRFIPLSLIATGEISLQPEKARIKILKSVAMSMVSESLLQDKDKLETELNQAMAQIGCRASPCATKSEVFSQVIDAILKTGLVDNVTRLNIMDPRYDEKLNRAETEKLKQISKDLRRFCLP